LIINKLCSENDEILLFVTHIYPHRLYMGSRNISISDEAYSRLAALKRSNESFTDVINRLAGKRSILELAGVLTAAVIREWLQPCLGCGSLDS